MRVNALLLLAALVCFLGLTGCGKDEPVAPSPAQETTPPQPTNPGPVPQTVEDTPRPDDPVDALVWIREAHTAGDKVALRQRLAAWPFEDEDWATSEEAQVVLTWRIRAALQDGALERAVDQYKLLLRHFDGHGVSPEGRRMMPDAVRLGLIDEARLLTRRRAEGPKHNALGAESAWKHGADLLTQNDHEEGDRLERSRRWALWETFDRWILDVGAKPGPGLGSTKDAQGARPYVVVVSDDFALGEVVLQSVLERWLKDGKDARLTGVLVPILRGEVRRGMRRMRAESAEEEIAAIEEDAAKAQLVPSWSTETGLFAKPFRDGLGLAKRMGLERQEIGLLIVDVRGRIVARLSGTGIDPRVLDPIIQKVTR